jgi:nucleotide-binding universal stress UspA family protein
MIIGMKCDVLPDMFRRILVGTDFSEASQSAIQTVLAFQQQVPEEITILHVDTRIHAHSNRHDCNCREQIVREIEHSIPPGNIGKVSIDVVKGASPAHELLSYAKAHHVDLIAIGSHHRNTLGEFLLGKAAQHVIRESTCPVLAVHEFSMMDRISFVPKKILMPTNFSFASGLALQLGEQMAEAFGAQVHFVHVMELPDLEGMHTQYWINELELAPSTGMNVNAILKTLCRQTMTRIPITLETLQGDPAEEILAYAQEHDIDLIVMGSHKSRAISRLVVGSVTSKIVSSASCPVITVSPSAIV